MGLGIKEASDAKCLSMNRYHVVSKVNDNTNFRENESRFCDGYHVIFFTLYMVEIPIFHNSSF